MTDRNLDFQKFMTALKENERLNPAKAAIQDLKEATITKRK